MSTTYILEPEPNPDDDIADFMAELDRDLASGSASPKRKAPQRTTYSDVVVEQQWFPWGTALAVDVQQCQCGATHTSVTGLFHQDTNKNGCIRATRTETILPAYEPLPRTVEMTTSAVPFCLKCFQEFGV